MRCCQLKLVDQFVRMSQSTSGNSYSTSSMAHVSVAIAQINTLQEYVQSRKAVVIDGHNLDTAAVVAVSRHGVTPLLTDSEMVKINMQRAAETVHKALSQEGGSLYGVTTGVGASAFTRTREVDQLQRAIVNKNLNGILPPLSTLTSNPHLGLILPEDFMKGTVMVRLNTLIRGHSGVRWTVIEKMFRLLEEDIVPCAPKNNTIRENRTIQKAPDVLKKINLDPITFGPKEAIAVLNGTAASTSAASQVLYDANVLLLAAQCVSVLTIEALRANLEPFQPFPHVVARPHPGQIEVAANIARMARGSKFAFEEYPEGDPEFKLRQDRYHIRCIPQWIGPFAENLVHATRQVDIELNSTTDNPIIDPKGEFPSNIYHAGNFQALSVADAMDKVRHAMQGVGKMLFAQHTEILNPLLNRGLPPDCAAGEPNLDYGLKSSDLACAAYLSELGFLAGSFLPHIHSAEHHNQSINSMALASARYARNSIELLQQLLATHLYTVCQALDLREMNARYLVKLRALLSAELRHILGRESASTQSIVETELFTTLRTQFGETTSMISDDRFNKMCAPLVYELYEKSSTREGWQLDESLTPIQWMRSFASKAKDLFLESRMEYMVRDESACDSLGAAGKIVYSFVRQGLGVKMRKGLMGLDEHEIGTGISEIFEAIRSGRMDIVWRDAMEDIVDG
ncbi:phenylalanine ammonia-lyase [Ramaria rubella]|nr:phenylalanine ammonia-lyase [Ramaria rubella]